MARAYAWRADGIEEAQRRAFCLDWCRGRDTSRRREKLHSFTLTRQEREFGSPLFRSFISGALAVVGTSPESVVRRIPVGWRLLFRDCGRFEIDGEGERWMRLAMHDVPRECLVSEAWMSCLPVGYAAATSVVKRAARGTLEVRAGTAYVVISWA